MKTPSTHFDVFRRVRGFGRSAVLCAVALGLIAPGFTSSIAAVNTLSSVVGVNTLDMVVNVDFDFDTPVGQAGDENTLVGKAWLTEVLRVTAQTMFTMTEGKHRLGTVYVYKNKAFGNNVDVQIINLAGRSSAHVAGWQKRNRSSRNFMAFGNGQARTTQQVGTVIAHEMGHYVYGLYDEYVERGRAFNPDQPQSPSSRDTAKDTLMNNQNRFGSLSTPADYADADGRETGQFRYYAVDGSRGSAWDVLTRPVSEDPEAARRNSRTVFEAFAGVNPNTLRITSPTAGFDAALNIVYASSPVFRDAILVDRTLNAARLSDLLQAAQQLVSEANEDTQFAVFASPALPGPAPQFITANAAGKARLADILSRMTSDASAGFDAFRVFTEAFAALPAVRKPGDPSTFHLLSGTELNVPSELASSTRLARVAVNPVGIAGGTAQQQARVLAQSKSASPTNQVVNLSELAGLTGGTYKPTRNGAQASADIVKAYKETHGTAHALIGVKFSPPLAAGAQTSYVQRLASGALDGVVELTAYFDPLDAARLSFELKSPGGSIIKPGSNTPKVAISIDNVTGDAKFKVAADFPNRTGLWTLTAQASAATADGVSFDAFADSRLQVGINTEGGALGAVLPPTIRATVGFEQSIRAVQVTANVFSEDGKLVLGDVVLKDDGKGGDAMPNDGEYTVQLPGKLSPGEYTVVVTAENTGSGMTAADGMFVQDGFETETAVERFVRVGEEAFSLQAGAPGVLPEPPVTGNGATGDPGTPGTPGTATGTALGNNLPGLNAGSGGGCAASMSSESPVDPILPLLALAAALALLGRQKKAGAGAWLFGRLSGQAPSLRVA